MATKALNRSLHAAKAAKQDEFCTQYVDIQKEVEAYLEFNPDTFRNKLGLKKLITTSYDDSPIAGQMTLFPEDTKGNGKRLRPKAIAVIVDHVTHENNDGAADIEDVKLFLKRNRANRIACSLRRSFDRAEGSPLSQRGRWQGVQPAISFIFTGPPK